MRFLYYSNFDNYFPNITIISIFTCLICFFCIYFPFCHFWKSLDRQELKNLIPILLKGYLSSFFLGSSLAIFFDFLQSFFFTDIDVFGIYYFFLIHITVLYIWFYIKLTYYPEWDLWIASRDLYESISSQDNDKLRDNFINNLKQQQITRKRQKWLMFKKIVIFCFGLFCFGYLLLSLIVAYIMFG